LRKARGVTTAAEGASGPTSCLSSAAKASATDPLRRTTLRVRVSE
jgi:hypothetical protein